MKKLKVMTVVGTRPEIIRLSCVIKKLDIFCEHLVVHTGQNFDYELNQIFFDDLDIRKPDHFLDAAGDTPAQTIANVISSIDNLICKECPDSILILGDTNSCLSAIPAKRRKIPIFHMEAGNRCFDMRVPEEINRRIIDHIADVNLTYSDIARECLLREGLSPDLIIKTGSPMFEVLSQYKKEIDQSSVLKTLDLNPGQYFVVSSHREENIDSDENLINLFNLLNEISEVYKLQIIFSAHPRTRNRIEDRGLKFHSLVKLIKPLGFFDYIKIQQASKAVLSDSGTISEESSILNFPALNLRDTQERHEAFEEAAVMMVGMDINKVMQGLTILESQPRGNSRLLRLVQDYSAPNVSDKVLRILHSYTDYVKRVIWKQY
jgi:UDP-N-acetylglucosamine 2-epimerase (non-hydrolysing)